MTAQPADERLPPDRGQEALLPKPAPRPDQTAFWDEWERDVQRAFDRIDGTLDKLPRGVEPS